MTEHAVVIVGNELADTRYLAYLLSIMQLGHLSAQSAQPGLSVQTLSKLSINIPDIHSGGLWGFWGRWMIKSN